MKKWLLTRFVDKTTKRLFNTITEEDILQMKENGGIVYKGQLLDRESKELIAAQSKVVSDTLVWKLLLDDMRYVANQRIYTKSSNPEDWLYGKVTLFIVEMMDKKLKILENLK